jgi:hypothetical protein
MKSDGVDAWLQHWLKLQKKNKCPLILWDPSKPFPTATTPSNGNGKRSKDHQTESIDSDEEDIPDEANNDGPNEESAGTTSRVGKNSNCKARAPVLPPSPVSSSLTRKSRRTFLQSLSNNKQYQKLIDLLGVADVSDRISIFS